MVTGSPSTDCGPLLRFRPAPSVRWAAEEGGIRLVDLELGRTRFLAYPEAAVWDLLSLSRSAKQVTALVGLLDPAGPPFGAGDLARLLERWRDEGFLEALPPDG